MQHAILQNGAFPDKLPGPGFRRAHATNATNAMATAELFMYHISLDQQANSSAVHALQALTRGLHQTHPPIQDLHTSTPNTNPLNYRQRAECRTTGVRHKAHKTIKSVDAHGYVRAAHHAVGESIVQRRLESTCSAFSTQQANLLAMRRAT